MKHFISLITLFYFVLVAHCTGAEYYIDSVNGSDNNDGLSIRNPWKSHTKVESASLAAGDVIHFKKGSAFSGNIRISVSGTAAKPLRLFDVLLAACHRLSACPDCTARTRRLLTFCRTHH